MRISYGLRPLPPAPIGCWMFSEIIWFSMAFCFFFAVCCPTGGGNYGIFVHLGVGVWKGVTLAFLGAAVDPNTCILGTLGGHFGTFGLILVTHRATREALKDTPWSQKRFLTCFWRILGLSWDHFGLMLVICCSFVVSKWEVRLRTSFLSVFGVEKQPQGIGCMMVFSFSESVCFVASRGHF